MAAIQAELGTPAADLSEAEKFGGHDEVRLVPGDLLNRHAVEVSHDFDLAVTECLGRPWVHVGGVGRRHGDRHDQRVRVGALP